MCLSKNQLIRLFVTLLVIKFELVRAQCDVCQTSNSVACHSETVFSLCINGTATRDDISCPDGSVSTADYLVCYPKSEAVPSCPRKYRVPEDHINSCGICNGPDKVFSCISERKIAFCFGHDEPNYEYTAICPEGSVCDLRNKIEFCTNATEIEPSCIKEDESTGQTTIRQADPTDDISDSTEMISIVTSIITMTTTGMPATTTATTRKSTTIETTTRASTKAVSTSTEPPTTERTSNKSTSAETTSTESTTTKSTTTIPVTTEPTTTKPTTTESTTTVPTTIRTSTAVGPTASSLKTTTKPTAITTQNPTRTDIASTTEKPTIPTTKQSTSTTPVPTITMPTTKPTTTTTTITTPEGSTTHRLPRDPSTLCKDMGEPGLSYPLDNDTACTQFIMCYRSNGILRGLSLNCEPDMYFHPELRICKSEKPANCV